jgi:hypothetical protein
MKLLFEPEEEERKTVVIIIKSNSNPTLMYQTL